ncbi:hypothetical protein BGZ93_009937 [Podila epicladia]|nr:hypothetical protein BGZ93_009937 [Podila epicladia]
MPPVTSSSLTAPAFIKATASATAEAKEFSLNHRKNGRLAATANQPSDIVTLLDRKRLYNNIPWDDFVDWNRCRVVHDAAHGDAETLAIQIYFAVPVRGEYNVEMVRVELRLQNWVWDAVNLPV